MDVVLESSTATQDETAQAFLRRCGKNLKEWKEGWRFLARREDGPECSFAELSTIYRVEFAPSSEINRCVHDLATEMLRYIRFFCNIWEVDISSLQAISVMLEVIKSPPWCAHSNP